MTKEIEKYLRDLLYEALSSINQEAGIVSLDYNQEEGKCTVILDVVRIPEEDYVGFAGY